MSYFDNKYDNATDRSAQFSETHVEEDLCEVDRIESARPTSWDVDKIESASVRHGFRQATASVERTPQGEFVRFEEVQDGDAYDRWRDEQNALEGERQHNEWCAKVKHYFQWRESLTPNENGDLDHYVDEDRQRREQYDITEADEVRWEASKYPDPNLPF